MKHYIAAFVIILPLLLSCSPRHFHGCGFMHNPGFEQFGASLERGNGAYIIKSYIRSERFLITEYIYENLDLTVPDTLVKGKEYDISAIPVTLWYAKGGQSGQIESTKADGTLKILDVNDKKMRLRLDLTFQKLKNTAGHYYEAPAVVHRSGILTAVKGYALY